MNKLLVFLDEAPFVAYGIAFCIALLAIFTPWPLSGLVLFSGFFLSFTYKIFLSEKTEVKRSLKIYLLSLGVSLLIVSAIFPLFRSGETYFGYDTGFYKHYLEQPLSSFPRPSALLLPNSAIGSRVFLDILSLSGLPTNFVLYGSLATIFILIGFALFVLSWKEFGTTTASITLVLFAVSFTQATAYQFFLWKQFFALALLLFVYLALYKKSVWVVLPAGLIFISHRTTSIFMLFSVFLTLWFTHPKYRRWLILTAIPVVIGFLWWQGEALFILERILILGASAPDYFAVREGQFISVDTYLVLNALLLPLAIAGIFYNKKRFNQPLFWLGLASLVFIVFQLPFYKRTLIFFDLSVIFYAGFALGEILPRLKILSARIVYFYFLHLVLIFGVLLLVFRNNTVSENYLQSIRQLQILDRNIPVMVVSSNDAPWVWGWSGHDVIAPGLFKDKWNQNEWFDFWTTSNPLRRQELMNRYPISPYVYVPSPTLLAVPLDTKCFQRLNDFVYQYACLAKNK